MRLDALRFICAALLVGSLVSGAAGAAGFVAYNDLVYSSDPAKNNPPLQPNVTTYTLGIDSSGPSAGLLKDFATGLNTGVTVTLTQSGGVHWQPDGVYPNGTGGQDCAVGTDAYNVFNPTTASLVGVIYYGDSGWYVEATFTGLNPAYTYEFVTSANRNKLDGSYDTRITRWNLSGADSFVNNSSAGTAISSAGATVRFNTGNNYNNGYVASWTQINPGADGSFVVRASAGSDENKAYAFSAFRLTEVVPEPGSIVTLGMGMALLLRRCVRK